MTEQSILRAAVVYVVFLAIISVKVGEIIEHNMLRMFNFSLYDFKRIIGLLLLMPALMPLHSFAFAYSDIFYLIYVFVGITWEILYYRYIVKEEQ